MGYLLDTCLISEVWKPAPNPGVVDWLGSSEEDELYISTLCLGEIRKGIGGLPDGKKKTRLLRDYAALRSRFSSRVLAVNAQTAERWGDLAADAKRAGRHLHVVDGLVAATALIYGHTLVTRNVSDFDVAPLPIVSPWR
jgi:predicted nucleic acid-binding protein